MISFTSRRFILLQLIFFSLFFPLDREHKKLSRFPSEHWSRLRGNHSQRCQRGKPKSDSRIVFFPFEAQTEAEATASTDGRKRKAAKITTGTKTANAFAGGNASAQVRRPKKKIKRFDFP